MKITVLGCGRWGSFLAWYMDKLGYETMLWGRKGSARLAILQDTRHNEYGALPPKVTLTDDLTAALDWGEMTLIAISAQQLGDLCAQIPGDFQKPLILCMRGLVEGKRLTEIVKAHTAAPCAVWVGPGHPQDFYRGVPNCMLADAEDSLLTWRIADAFGSELIRFYLGNDLVGAEVGAAAKNVVGLAAGMLDGLGYGSLKGVLMARGAREISRLISAMGGQELTAYGLSHLGDYEATLFSPHSHNRAYGEAFIRREPFPRLAEGVDTVKSLVRLACMHHVELPICTAVHAILYRRADAAQALTGLFLRPVKTEF